MFDPSKINLDENSKEDLKVKKEIKTSQNNEKVDILWSLDQKNKSDKPSFQEEQKDSTFLLDNKKEDEDDGLVEEKKEKKKIIFDVNIKSLKDILNILIDKEKKYDFVTFEPDNKKITISFRKNWKIVENKYIKYNIYSSILIKIKSLTKLEIEETEKTQEWKWKLTIESENYNVVTKIVPSGFWENLFIKLTKTWKTKKQLKEKKRSSISQMLAFFGSLVFISLIIGWGFLSFIVINAKTVDDVRFFESLNINLNQINAFIWKFIFIIFLLLTFILVILLVIFLFKFLLTKKIYKNKKVRYWIVSLFLFLLIFWTVSSWMYITKKVENLPSWWEIVKW